MFKTGDKVIIQHYRENPAFWDPDGEMMKLSGTMATINSAIVGGRYKLREYRYTWRKQDLVPIGPTEIINNPNLAFRIRKRE